MKKILSIFFFFVIGSGVFAQPCQKEKEEKPIFISTSLGETDPELKAVDIDNLSNLWIITMDKSTLEGESQLYLDNSILFIIKTLQDCVYPRINFDKDRFVFYNTGVVKDTGMVRSYTGLNALRSIEANFTDAYIHFVYQHVYSPKKRRRIKTTNVKFKKHRDKGLSDKITEYLEANEHNSERIYPYKYSFVSLNHTLSLSKTLKYFKKEKKARFNLLNFNKIYVLSITNEENALSDENDYWLTDYKTIKEYAPEKLKEINTVISRLVVSPFSKTEKPFARFVPVFNKANSYWRVSLLRYETFRSIPDTIGFFNDILKLEKKNGDIFVKLAKKRIWGNAIEQVSIKTFALNRSTTPSTDFIFKDSFPVNISINKFFENNMRISGYAQVIYNDPVLGKKRKKIYFKQTINFYSNIYDMILKILLLGSLLLFVVYVSQKQMIVVTPAGSVVFKRGFFLFSKFTKQNILMLLSDGQKITKLLTCESVLSFLFVKNNPNLVFEANDSDYEMVIMSKKSFEVTSVLIKTELYKKKSDKKSTAETKEMKEIINAFREGYNLRFVQKNTERFISIDNKYNIVKNYIEEINQPDDEAKNRAMISKYFIENNIFRKANYFFMINEVGNKVFYNFVRFCTKNKPDVKILITYQRELGVQDNEKAYREIKQLAKKYHLNLHKKIIYENDSAYNKQLSHITTSVYPLFVAIMPDNEVLKEKDVMMIYDPLLETDQVTFKIPEMPDDGRHYYLYQYSDVYIYRLSYNERIPYQVDQLLPSHRYTLDLSNGKIKLK